MLHIRRYLTTSTTPTVGQIYSQVANHLIVNNRRAATQLVHLHKLDQHPSILSLTEKNEHQIQTLRQQKLDNLLAINDEKSAQQLYDTLNQKQLLSDEAKQKYLLKYSQRHRRQPQRYRQRSKEKEAASSIAGSFVRYDNHDNHDDHYDENDTTTACLSSKASYLEEEKIILPLQKSKNSRNKYYLSKKENMFVTTRIYEGIAPLIIQKSQKSGIQKEDMLLVQVTDLILHGDMASASSFYLASAPSTTLSSETRTYLETMLSASNDILSSLRCDYLRKLHRTKKVAVSILQRKGLNDVTHDLVTKLLLSWLEYGCMNQKEMMFCLKECALSSDEMWKWMSKGITSQRSQRSTSNTSSTSSTSSTRSTRSTSNSTSTSSSDTRTTAPNIVDVNCFNVLLSALRIEGSEEEATRILDQVMDNEGIAPNAMTWEILQNPTKNWTFIRAKRLSKLQEMTSDSLSLEAVKHLLMEKMYQKGISETIHHNIFLKRLKSSSDIQQHINTVMLGQQVESTTVLSSSSTSTHNKVYSIAPDAITYSTLISRFGIEGQPIEKINACLAKARITLKADEFIKCLSNVLSSTVLIERRAQERTQERAQGRTQGRNNINMRMISKSNLTEHPSEIVAYSPNLELTGQTRTAFLQSCFDSSISKSSRECGFHLYDQLKERKLLTHDDLLLRLLQCTSTEEALTLSNRDLPSILLRTHDKSSRRMTLLEDTKRWCAVISVGKHSKDMMSAYSIMQEQLKNKDVLKEMQETMKWAAESVVPVSIGFNPEHLRREELNVVRMICRCLLVEGEYEQASELYKDHLHYLSPLEVEKEKEKINKLTQLAKKKEQMSFIKRQAAGKKKERTNGLTLIHAPPLSLLGLVKGMLEVSEEMESEMESQEEKEEGGGELGLMMRRMTKVDRKRQRTKEILMERSCLPKEDTSKDV